MMAAMTRVWERRLAAGAAAIAACVVLGGSASASAPATATFTIDLAAGHKPISPLIYGINDDADQPIGANPYASDVAGAHPSVLRLGGDVWSDYDWVNNDTNPGNDYCFENQPNVNDATDTTVPGAAVKQTIDDDVAAGIPTVVTIPIGDYVAGDGGIDDPSQPLAPSATQCTGYYVWQNPDGTPNSNYLGTRFRANAATGPVTDTPSATGPVYQNQFSAG